MTQQQNLFAEAPLAPSGLTCANGTAWASHFNGTGCALCAADTERTCAAFDAAVAAGIYDAQGYTPKERRALARRRP